MLQLRVIRRREAPRRGCSNALGLGRKEHGQFGLVAPRCKREIRGAPIGHHQIPIISAELLAGKWSIARHRAVWAAYSSSAAAGARATYAFL